MKTQNLEMNRKFKAVFEAEKERILLSGKQARADFAIQPEELMDEVDFTSFELESQMKMRLRSRETLYLKKIEEALDRIQAGTFGECEKCEESIEYKRLEARPTTTLCVSCKEDEERLEKIHIDGHQHKSLGREFKLA